MLVPLREAGATARRSRQLRRRLANSVEMPAYSQISRSALLRTNCSRIDYCINGEATNVAYWMDLTSDSGGFNYRVAVESEENAELLFYQLTRDRYLLICASTASYEPLWTVLYALQCCCHCSSVLLNSSSDLTPWNAVWVHFVWTLASRGVQDP